MSHRSFFISLIVLVLLLPAGARAQEPATSGSDESAALKKKAVDLLITVAGQIDGLRSPANRARIGSNTAEALWNHDEKRARSLFASVGADIRAGFADTDSDVDSHNHTMLVYWQLRSDTINRIAGHDPELALEFLRATRLSNDQLILYGTQDNESSQELRLAGQVAAKNPDLALKLGRESLARGFSPDLLSMLSTLQSQNKGMALSFFQLIVDKLKTVNVIEDTDATRFAFVLARGFQPPQADEQVYRELIGFILMSALENGCQKDPTGNESEICFQIGSVFPLLRKYYGPRAAPLQKWSQEWRQEPEQPNMWLQSREVAEKGTVDEILAFARKNPEFVFEVSGAAVMKAEMAGDFARARKIAADVYPEEQLPAMLAQIDQDQKRMAVNANNPATIQQALSTFQNDEDRILFLLSASEYFEANDGQTALELLNQASHIVDSTRGKTQLHGQVGLARQFCAMKSSRAFEILESLVPRVNQFVTAAAVLDGLETNYFRDEEWSMTGQGELGVMLTALVRHAGCFARLDFERTVTLANQLERLELRLMAELKIAQGVLAEQPRRVPAPAFQRPASVP